MGWPPVTCTRQAGRYAAVYEYGLLFVLMPAGWSREKCLRVLGGREPWR